MHKIVHPEDGSHPYKQTIRYKVGTALYVYLLHMRHILHRYLRLLSLKLCRSCHMGHYSQ